MQKEQAIALIKGRIKTEQEKHPELDWQEIAARKIYSQWSEYFKSINNCNECGKELGTGTVFCSADCRIHFHD